MSNPSDVDVIWGDEAGKALRLTRIKDGALLIEVLTDITGPFTTATVEGSVTLSNWRRARVVDMAALKQESP